MKRRTRTRAPAPVRTADLLFEIGTEELPAAYLPVLIEELATTAHSLLEGRHLRFGELEAYGTPRRLVLVVRRLEGTQRKPAEEIRGPSKQVSFSPQGKPTKALTGFLRARGGTLQQIKVVPSLKGEYVYLLKSPTTVPTAQILPEMLTQLIGRLHAPKTMRWDDSGLRFARPIRWLLACYGARPLRCAVGRLVSGNRTWIDLPKHPRALRVASVSQYFTTLARAGVIVDQRKRRAAIEQMVRRAARQRGGAPAPEMVSHGLLDEVAFLVEQPQALVGTFDEQYLQLPREVLLASMAKYQRVFALDAARSRPAALLPTFVAVLEGTPKAAAGVRRMVEHILNARLADSLLFWKEDHQRLPLETMARGLSGVTFHEHLGSMADKTDRLRKLCAVLTAAWNLSQDESKHLERAAELAKADLVSTMVREFPTLQGVIGKYYAIDSSETRPVAQAIEEHYLPAKKRMPQTPVGMALAILDKFDTLVNYFGIGIEPTGDQDPFGLRRAAQGIVEVAWAARRPLPVTALLRASSGLEPLRRAAPNVIASTSTRVQRYLQERLYTFNWPRPAPSNDYIDAVLGSPCDDLIETMDRVRSLQELDGNLKLLRAAKVIERTRNILRGATLQQTQVEPSRFQEPLERELWELYRSNEAEMARLSGEGAYAKATTLFGEVFFKPLHEFFEQVLVNVPDASLQQNRLALMHTINRLYTDKIADLSKLRILQREEIV